MVMVEALACGTPVIAFPEGAARELVVDGETGFLVDDEAAMAAAVGRLARDRADGLPRAGSPSTATSTSSPRAYERAYRAAARTERRPGRRCACLSARLSVLDGSTFVVGDRLGDVRADGGPRARLLLRGHALRLALGAAGRRRRRSSCSASTRTRTSPPSSSSTPRRRPRRAGAVLGHAPPLRRPTCGSRRSPSINHRHEQRRCASRSTVDADFADLFEVKDGLVAPREVDAAARTSATLVARPTAHEAFRALGHDRRRPRRRTITRSGLAFALELARGEQWSVDLHASPRTPRSRARRSPAARCAAASTTCAREQVAPSSSVARPRAARWSRTTRRSRAPIARASPTSRRCGCSPTSTGRRRLPAAGLPWFMALFGRDSLITSFQALPYLPGLAATTLRVLAARQAHSARRLPRAGAGQDPARAALRRADRDAARGRTRPYFGTADATPLFLVLLDEYHRWTRRRRARPGARAQRPRRPGVDRGQRRRRRRRLRRVRAPQHRHRPGQPVLEGQLGLDPVRRRHARPRADRDLRDPGLRLRRAPARRPPGPRGVGRPGARRATRGRRRRPARALPRGLLDARARLPRPRARRRQAPGRQPDLQHRPPAVVRARWTTSEAAATAERLLDDALYSGWGVRTLGAREAGYNPLGYHTGTVWPHENSLIAAGLARYGHREAASAIAVRDPRPRRRTSSTASPRSSPAIRRR